MSSPATGTPPAPGPQLLLVEDEESIGSLVRAYLEQTGYRVAWVRSGEDALSELPRLRPRLVVLDVGLPGKDGFDICRAVRQHSTVPIVMLTARSEAESRIQGLEIGADDYVAKPFEPRELSLRIANILRHSRPATPPPRETVRFGEFVFHLARGELRRGEEVLHLTDREREMLRMLATHPGETVPRLSLSADGGTIGERAVDVQINRLRRKIENDPANPLIVQTVRGVGYRLVVAA